MDANKAKALIAKPFEQSETAEHWMDLGCGAGVFTSALAALLPKNSSVLAVDQIHQNIRSEKGNVTIEFLQANFVSDKLPQLSLHGILMANSLHYVQDKERFLKSLSPLFQEAQQYLIVEYDTERSNPWVPYPISFMSLRELMFSVGLHTIDKIGTYHSAYGGTMYAAWIR